MQTISEWPVFTSWGQVALVGLGGILAVKWLLPLMRNGRNGEGEWRGKVEQLLVSNTEVLGRLAESHVQILTLLQEIERRTRGNEDAIRLLKERAN